jgi:hypothetical protein
MWLLIPSIIALIGGACALAAADEKKQAKKTRKATRKHVAARAGEMRSDWEAHLQFRDRAISQADAMEHLGDDVRARLRGIR